MNPTMHEETTVYSLYQDALVQAHDESNTDMAKEALAKVPKGTNLTTRIERQPDGTILKYVLDRNEIVAARRLKLNLSFEVEEVELEYGRIKE